MQGAFFLGAEFSVFFALNEGPTGPVSAVISMNVVIVSILTWVITGISLTILQIGGICVAIFGVIIVALSKPAQNEDELNKNKPTKAAAAIT